MNARDLARMADDQELLLKARLNQEPLVQLPIATDYVAHLDLPSVPQEKPVRANKAAKKGRKILTGL